MGSVWTVFKLSTESVGSRRELVANCVHTADADATKQFRRVGVGGMYWTLVYRIAKTDKWRAVAAQTARCHSKVLTIPYIYYFRAYQSQWNGRQIRETRSQLETISVKVKFDSQGGACVCRRSQCVNVNTEQTPQ